jgi:RNA polymerase sigma factor (sigma-70 family)
MDQVSQPPVEGSNSLAGTRLLVGLEELIERLYRSTQAQQFGLTLVQFQEALERSAVRNFPQNSTVPSVPISQIAAYLESLRLEDLVLASACMEDCPGAWDHFVAAYQSHLRASASAILRCPVGAPAACEMADSLFADLYGLSAGPRRERSLFRYFAGRSSLKTWLRAILAQRHIDCLREARRFTGLQSAGETSGNRNPDESAPPSFERVQQRSQNQSHRDPHCDRYLAAFAWALHAAIAGLDSRDLHRLRLYYAKDKTLAEVGLEIGEHESSVSRNLERTRRDLRRSVTAWLRGGAEVAGGRAMSEGEIALCFEYAAEDAPIDLQTLFLEPADPQAKHKGERR